MSGADITSLANDAAVNIAVLDKRIAKLLIGRKAIVRSRYNGQPYGRSAKSWTGREVTISHAFYSGPSDEPRIAVWLTEERVGGGSASLWLEELEVL